MINAKRLIVVTILILILTYATSLAGLEVKITPLKTTYLLLEPVAIHYQVKNVGAVSVVFRKDEIANYFKLVASEDNKDFSYQHFEIEDWDPPPTLKPGESVEGTMELVCGKRVSKFSSTITLPVGKHRVYLAAKYDGDKISKSNTMDIEIVEATEREKEAFREVLIADSLMHVKDVIGKCRILVNISRNYPASVYAQTSLQHALISYSYAGEDKSKLAVLGREFIDKYPNSRYLQTPLWILVEYYQSKKDKIGYIKELNSIIEKYPGTEVSKLAKKRLETVDNVKF